MSLDATQWAWQQRAITPTQKLVLLSMADRAGEDHRCWPSNARLCQDTGLDRKTVYGCIEKLEALNIIRTHRQKGVQNVYELLGVRGREDAQTGRAPCASVTSAENITSPKIGTSPETDTSAENGTEPVPKTDFDQSQKRDTNLKENLSRTGKSARVAPSVPCAVQGKSPKAAPSTRPSPPPKQPPAKTPHGESGHVLLTEAEHTRLCTRYGREWTEEAVNLLDLHISAGGKDKYVSHCAALQKWVFDAVNERRLKLRMPPFTRPDPPERREAPKPQPYDHDLTPEELLRNRAAAQKARQQYFNRREHHA